MTGQPPFKLASAAVEAVEISSGGPHLHDRCCGGGEVLCDTSPAARAKLSDLDPQLHCSILGTCLSTSELRKLMAKFTDVHKASDLDVHHDAVRLAGEAPLVSKALHKALDRRHEAVLQRFSKTRDAHALNQLWDDALRQGEVPGAYWAVLTHRSATRELRQRAFGEVHMLSHLVGAANRADIRRLVALERDNADLNDRLDRQQLRSQQLLEERDAAMASARVLETERTGRPATDVVPLHAALDTEALISLVAVQTLRRERAEGDAFAAVAETQRLQQELVHLRDHARILSRELSVAEDQLRTFGVAVAEFAPSTSLASHLSGRRFLYVGGRPSSTPSIRDLVERHGGEFQKHDGGLEDRKGLLESSVAWAEFVLFPVDCIDHDSASRLKRLCAKLGTPFVPLRSASVASFAAAVADLDVTVSRIGGAGKAPICLRQG